MFQALAPCQSDGFEGIVGCVRVYMQKIELCYWWEYGDEKTRIN